MAHRKQSNFVIERHKAFDNHAAGSTSATTRLGNVPGIFNVGFGLDDALTVTGRTHHRLYNARDTDFLDRSLEIFVVIRKAVRARLESELFGSQAANAFAVHRELRGLSGRDDIVAFLFEFHERVRCNRFDFRHDVVRFFLFNDGTEFLAIEHVDHVAAMSHLHARSVGVTVHCNHFDAKTHHLDDDFLAQFTRTAK